MKTVFSGLDVLLKNPKDFLNGNRIALVVNHTSLAKNGTHSLQLFHQHPEYNLIKLFSPEHGLYGVDQDMKEVEDSKDPLTGVPVYSLYGKDENSLKPDPNLFKDIDTLIFDIQDIGSRYYTFIYTMAYCMEACREAGVPIIICDRPNPINGKQVEGNIVQKNWFSFVGQYPLPNRHGMTSGELALMFNDHFKIGSDLKVIPMKGWRRSMWYDETGLLWVAPSPNMPTLETAIVYPGMCFFEGTQSSEGRGTTMPFLQCGDPGMDPKTLAEALNSENLPGIIFVPHFFKPTFQKWAGQICGGVQLHLIDRNLFKPVLTGLTIISKAFQLFPTTFKWRTEPYEFVNDRLAIDLLYGNSDFREKWVAESSMVSNIESTWENELAEFKILRENYLIPDYQG